jgi:uncharacterized protein (DUF2164 family)
MKPIQFSREERAEIVKRIQTYMQDELDFSLGSIPAEQLLGFFTDEIGAFYYNRGLEDAQAVFSRKLDDINDAIYGLEQRHARVK